MMKYCSSSVEEGVLQSNCWRCAGYLLEICWRNDETHAPTKRCGCKNNTALNCTIAEWAPDACRESHDARNVPVTLFVIDHTNKLKFSHSHQQTLYFRRSSKETSSSLKTASNLNNLCFNISANRLAGKCKRSPPILVPKNRSKRTIRVLLYSIITRYSIYNYILQSQCMGHTP